MTAPPPVLAVASFWFLLEPVLALAAAPPVLASALFLL